MVETITAAASPALDHIIERPRLIARLEEGAGSRVSVFAAPAAPAIGSFIAEETPWRGWLQRLLSASSDTSLASSLGLRVPRAAKRTADLTPRESEVHDLLSQGLTNEAIAKLLYISLSYESARQAHLREARCSVEARSGSRAT